MNNNQNKSIFISVSVLIISIVFFILSQISNPQENQQRENPKPTSDCGLSTCHGIDNVVCGKPAEMCSDMYMIGDRCLQHVKCEKINNQCVQVNNEAFNSCKKCIQDCTKPNIDPAEQFICESNCN